MKLIRFSRGFVPAACISTALIVFGLVGYAVKGGFNLGVDFKAGLLQEVQIAPPAFNLTWDGSGNASVQLSRDGIAVVVTGAQVDNVTHSFTWTRYPTLGGLTGAMNAVPGLHAAASAPADTPSTELLQSAYGNPELGDAPFTVHYLAPDAAPIDIADVRASFPPELGDVSLQVLGAPAERRFMVRINADNLAEGVAPEVASAQALGAKFGGDNIVITRSDKVDSRFSRDLTRNAALLFLATLVLILIYSAIRFKPGFAIGAVLAIAHDALIMVAFIVWTRMEFNTTSIAAILTILGYSINDTIVIFDRVRENRRLLPDEAFVDVLDRSISETLSRTIITTVTTMLAVVSLFIFTTGSMKDFAAALLVGMLSGVYSTIFIACGFTNFYDKLSKKRQARRLAERTAAARAAKAPLPKTPRPPRSPAPEPLQPVATLA